MTPPSPLLPEQKRQTVKVTEFWDNPNQIHIADAVCLICGIKTLHREEKNGFVVTHESRTCNCSLLPS